MKVNIGEKIENIITVYIVSQRSNKTVRPEKIKLDEYGVNILAVFENRKQAEKWVNYWNDGKSHYDIFERKLA